MQIEPMKPKLKAPRTKRLKLRYDDLLSNLLRLCFQIQVAPVHEGAGRALLPGGVQERGGAQEYAAVVGHAHPDGGAGGRGLHSFTFQLNVSAFCGIGGASGVV